MLAGRYEDAERLSAEAEDAGMRAGDRNAGVFAGIVRFCSAARARGVRAKWTSRSSRTRSQTRQPASPTAADTPGCSPGVGETERAREQLHATMKLTHAFDANWLSLQAELAEASVLLGDATFAATLYERLAPYAGRPVTAGRAACSYGAVDRTLGGLAGLLGRESDAVRHLEDAIRLNDAFGCVVWRTRAERDLSQLVRNGPLAG